MKHLAKGWKLIGSKIKMEAAQPIGRFLGCQQSIGQLKMIEWENPRYAWMKENPCKKDPPVILSEREKTPLALTVKPLK